MYKTFFAVLGTLWVFSPSLHAGLSSNRLSSDSPSSDSICKQLFDHKRSLSQAQTLGYMKDSLDLMFRKNMLAQPLKRHMFVAPSFISSTSPSSSSDESSDGQAVIVNLGFRYPFHVKDEFVRQKKRYEELNRWIQLDYKHLRWMGHTPNEDLCQRMQIRTGFSWETLQARLQEKNTLSWAKRHFEYTEVHRILENQKKHWHLPWRVQASSHLEAVRQLLLAPSTRHVILIAHGKPPGELLDGYDALYHGSFFKRVSPQLESLSLFSCHSEDAAEFYDLSNLLTHQTSFHPERLLFTVKPNHIYDKKNIAPISLLGGFIKSIDHTLHAQLHSQRPSQKARQAKALPPTPLCTLELNHVALTTGSISVLINQHIVGVLHPASPQDDAVFSFPCNLLHSLRADSLGGEGPRGEPNSLVLLNSMHQDRSVLKTISRIQAKIQTPFGFAYSPKFEAPLLSEAEDFKKMIAFF